MADSGKLLSRTGMDYSTSGFLKEYYASEEKAMDTRRQRPRDTSLIFFPGFSWADSRTTSKHDGALPLLSPVKRSRSSSRQMRSSRSTPTLSAAPRSSRTRGRSGGSRRSSKHRDGRGSPSGSRAGTSSSRAVSRSGTARASRSRSRSRASSRAPPAPIAADGRIQALCLRCGRTEEEHGRIGGGKRRLHSSAASRASSRAGSRASSRSGMRSSSKHSKPLSRSRSSVAVRRPPTSGGKAAERPVSMSNAAAVKAVREAGSGDWHPMGKRYADWQMKTTSRLYGDELSSRPRTSRIVAGQLYRNGNVPEFYGDKSTLRPGVCPMFVPGGLGPSKGATKGVRASDTLRTKRATTEITALMCDVQAKMFPIFAPRGEGDRGRFVV